jgi:hypothetical protein
MVKMSRRMPPTPVAAPWYGSTAEGWLWDSTLKATAYPSPTSMTPAFSPGPWITHGASVGRSRSSRLEFLYPQCSDHMALKTPSSVKVVSRPPRIRLMRSYSSSERPWSATTSGVMGGSPGRGSAGLGRVAVGEVPSGMVTVSQSSEW